jgi:hypothetical protein
MIAYRITPLPSESYDPAHAIVRDTGTPSSRPFPASAKAKTSIVAVLGWILAWRPSLAIRLGKLVLRVWPQFRRA